MNCKICGKNKRKMYIESLNICSAECLLESIWQDLILEKDLENHLVINNKHYIVGPEQTKSILRGFNGQKFTIKKDNGEIIETTNLWCQGEVPEKYRDKLVNNAIFL